MPIPADNPPVLQQDTINPAYWPLWAKIVSSASAFLLSGFLFIFLLYPQVGLPGSVFILIPAGLIGWAFGLRGGFIGGLIGVVANTFMYYAVGEDGLAVTFGGGLTGAITLLFASVFISWVSDIVSHTRDLTIELEHARIEAEDANFIKTEFLSKVSHELRTPLNAILGYAELMSGGIFGEVNDPQREKLHAIVSNAKELNALVENLLEVSRLEISTFSPNASTFAISAVLNRVVSHLKLRAEDKGLTFTMQLDQDFIVTSDRLRVTQILSNLVENAIKYTDSGSIHIHAYQPDSAFFCLLIQDTGKGISEEEQLYIFDAFRQAPNSSDSTPGGIGLGLAIVQEIINFLEGQITLESELGKGSDFLVTLPADMAF